VILAGKEEAMQAVLLAGGKGTRLRPFTATIPKPLLPLGDLPIVEVVIRQLACSGITRIAISLGHMAHLFSATIGDGSRFGVTIEYYVEEEPLGTAGPLRLIRDLGEHVLVMNGDLLTTLDYRDLMNAHLARDAWATIAVRRREVKIDLGVVVTTLDGRLLDYQEKPVIPYEVSMGINVIARRCLELIPPGRKFDIPELMLAIKKEGHDVHTFKTDCYWQDIGRFDDYEQACADFESEPTRFLPDMTPGPGRH
jgi:NDP-mannose synthase